MADAKIKVHLASSYDSSGARQAAGHLETIRAKIRAASEEAAKARAAKAAKRLGDNASVASRKVGGLVGAVSQLTEGTGFLGKTLANLAKGGLWEMGAAGVRLLFDVVKKSFTDQIDAAKEAEQKSIESINAMADSLSKYKSSVAEVGAAVRAAADAALTARQKEIDLTERLAKANAELARQKRIAAGEDAATVSAEIDSQLSAGGAMSARARADAEIEAAQRRLDATMQEHEAAVAEVNRLRDARSALGESWDRASQDPEALKAGRKLRSELTKKIEDARATEFGAYDRIKEDQKALDDAKRRREAIDAEIAASELKAVNDRAAAEKEAAQKAAEARAAAERKAAEDAARERDRLDRELHQKRMADLRAEIEEQKKAASPLSAVSAVAATEFERAFAMYRDPSRAAAEIGEEKDRSADLERLHRDANRYGGKWRIDELSQLMAAGDSQGVDSRLAEWRKSRSFSPEVEAMVRASAAEQSRTTAEEELRKIEHNTAGLSAKLDELLTMRG